MLRHTVQCLTLFLAMMLFASGCQKQEEAENKQEIFDKRDVTEQPESVQSVNFKGVKVSKKEEDKFFLIPGVNDFCTNTDQGGVYYVKWWEKKRFLYYCHDGKEEKILNKFVSQLCYMDGILYFLYDETKESYDPLITPSYEGILACLDTETGEYSVLSEVKSKELYLTKEGIYCFWTTGPEEEIQERKYYFYSFEDKEMEILDEEKKYLLRERYGKYALVPKYGTVSANENSYLGHVLKDILTGEEIQLWDSEEGNSFFGIYIEKDMLFYTVREGEECEKYCLDLATGKTEPLFVENPEDSARFTQIDGMFYRVCPSSNQITVYDPDENQMEDLSVKKLKKSENYHLTQIKTDGTCYYTLLKTRETSENYYDGLKGISILQKQGKKFVELWSSVSDGK